MHPIRLLSSRLSSHLLAFKLLPSLAVSVLLLLGQAAASAAPSQGPTAPPNPTNYAVTATPNNVIVSGTIDIGNHCDDCTTAVTLPFAFDLYGVLHTSVNVSSNGNIQFTGNSAYFGVACLPNAILGRAMMPYQDDLRTDGTGDGIFTSVTGVTPNRIFNIEWRTEYFARPGRAAFEVRLYEGQSKFEYEYGATADNGSQEVAGVQWDGTAGSTYLTQYSCLAANTLTPGTTLTFTRAPTSVRVTSIGARSTARGVLVHWRTASVADVLGFEVWRQKGTGKLRKLNRTLIPAKPGVRAASYSFVDTNARRGGLYRYRLQLVTLSGAKHWLGTAAARVSR